MWLIERRASCVTLIEIKLDDKPRSKAHSVHGTVEERDCRNRIYVGSSLPLARYSGEQLFRNSTRLGMTRTTDLFSSFRHRFAMLG